MKPPLVRYPFRAGQPVSVGCAGASRTSCFSRLPWLICLALAFGLPALTRAQDHLLKTDYRNYWFSPSPTNGPYSNYFGIWPTEGLTNASTALYCGHVLGNTNNTLPQRGGYGLEWSAFGQPVENIQSDFALGQPIAAPDGTDTNRPPANFVAVRVGDNTNAYYESPGGGAFWVPSTRQVIFARPNDVTIDWINTDGSTNRRVVNVDAVPTRRPAKLFWTESPYYAPAVNLQGLFPAIHYNAQVWKPAYEYTTNVSSGFTNIVTNIVSGVWLDEQKQLHAKNVTGTFLIEYYETGMYSRQVQPHGIEVVQVLAPSLQTIYTDVGARLMPVDLYWANLDTVNGVIPNVTQGMNETAYVYAHTGLKYNWAFAIKRTWEEPSSLEIYWQHRGVMGVLWPYEKDWYSCNWPAHPQLFVLGDSPDEQAPTLIPPELNVELEPDMEPELQAQLSTTGRSFRTTKPGTCLLKYTTDDNIWFEVVKTVGHTNYFYFDLEPREWPIGEELTPGRDQSWAMGFEGEVDYVSVGESFLNLQTNWTLSLWFKIADFRAATLYSEGNPNAAFRLSLTNGQVQAATWNKTLAAKWTTATTINAPLTFGHWHYLTLTYAASSETNGTLRFYLDDYVWETNGVPRVNFDGDPFAVIGAITAAPQPTNGFFYGKLDQLRVWDMTLSADQVRLSPDATLPETAGRLVADYPFDEGQGEVIHNAAGDKDGTVRNGALWCYGRVVPGGQWSGFPGYIYLGEGDHAAGRDRYNVNRYAYPDEANPSSASFVFAVNTGILEVWWAHRSRQADMPAVYYPSQVVRYTNDWPSQPSQIVIASGLGSSGDSLITADEALSFADKPGAQAVVPNNSVLDVGNQLTVEAWVMLTGRTNDWYAVSRAQSTPYWNGFSLGGSNEMMRVSVWNNATSSNQYSVGAGSIPVGAWTHLAFTYQAGGALIAYINGQEVGRSNVVNSPVGVSVANLVIGQRSWSSSAPPFPGVIGEVRIWNLARSAAELLAARRPRLIGDEAGLVAYYPFVRGANSSVLADAGPFGLQGTISGAAWTAPGRQIQVSGPLAFGSPSIYFQNDPDGHGYNPNEEHALIMGGVAYALRNDLNRVGTNIYSEPYVLVDYLDPASGRPKMIPFSVVLTNELYSFDRDLVAGLPIVPPMPLGAMPLATNNYSTTKPPAWQDRKLAWWAISAGDDGGTKDAVMRFYYQMQPTFYVPSLVAGEQPAVGTELPWLPREGAYFNPPTGIPISVVYHITWPDPVPKLHLGQTLTKAASGLPDIWSQLSVEVLYQQSVRQDQGQSVDLFDPVVSHGVDLTNSVVNAMISSQLARRDTTGPLVRFPNLPPSLYPRLYYDRNRGDGGQLVLAGQYVETLTGGGYLLLNMLEPFEQTQAYAAATGIDSTLKLVWDAAVNALPTAITEVVTNVPYVHAALGARLSSGAGYVTVAFNNSTNAQQVPPALPVSLEVIRVDTNLYSGELEVIQPGDVLAEQLSLRYSADFAGHVDECDFRWRWVEPAGGLIPNTEFDDWTAFRADPTRGTNEVTIVGASPFTLADHYFAVQYRPHNTNGPSGANWSEWTYNLAPGWVKRVMNGINPFMQALTNMTANPVDTRTTMISQAGGPYEGDIALNMDAASQAGLIATYETVFNRAMDFSLRASLSDASMNETLLYAASRLHDLYMVLGNEAFADAQDPTIAFPQDLSVGTAGATATSIFPFMNQEPNLLEEELALLRGRDDTLNPPVTTSPVYNRLIWNFTAGINGGEPAYAYNYDIRGDPSNTIGIFTADDAKRLYPQGHGDAWGHYLSAIRHYYDLLSYTNFYWHTEPSATLVGNAAVSVDFFDEQKFAETAAARARVGAAIVKQTFRQRYSEDPTGRWAAYTDSDTNRAWGISEWASRAGQAAYYDWAVVNSLLLDSLTNMTQVGRDNVPPEGIQKIDRGSTPELNEITASLRDIQSQVDSVDGGLNPLGLARNVVPFDIDPTAIDAGKTHFEQIYDRALQALRNACIAFDQARGASLQLRKQFESVYDLQESLAQNETDFHNRLIQIYGYPYADDIGPTGAYPEGYDGPDLINWQILDMEHILTNGLVGEVMTQQVYNLIFTPSTNTFSSTNYSDYINLPNEASRDSNDVGTITVYLADNGLKVKPPTWTGRRRAQGELQLALSDYVQAWYALKSKIEDYDKTLAQLEVDLERLQAQYGRYTQEWQANDDIQKDKIATATILEGLRAAKTGTDLIWKSALDIGLILSDVYPTINTGFLGPFPSVNTGIQAASTLQRLASYVASVGPAWISRGLDLGIDTRQMQQSIWEAELAQLMNNNNYKALLKWNTSDTLVKLQDQYVKQAELFAKVQALSQSYERIQKLLASGEQLIFQRGQVRSRAAQRIQMGRYGDLAFRIYRDDALRRYQDAFDLAARYTYLAAKAYDYETGLLYSDISRTPGSKFLEDVVRARAPGRFYVWLGEPMIGGSVGEPGLADILARMKADWSVVKGRFGFNNPATETSRFSLRTELWRISDGGDDTWAEQLDNCKVADLHQVPEFIRYCRPYIDTTNVEPGLVIPFSTCVVAGKNYFGRDLAGGDNAYDASHAATKIRSVGVWFSGYDTTFNTNSTGPGLANEPRVYLIPVGEDVLRSPTRNAVQLHHWQVLDQAIPLPYNVGGADVDSPDWIPVIHSLPEPLAQIRRFASFRAYHDSGQFNEAETHNNGRLVGRSVWNTSWLLIIPGRTLLADPKEGIERFIRGAWLDNGRDGNGIKDIKIFFQTYSIPGD